MSTAEAEEIGSPATPPLRRTLLVLTAVFLVDLFWIGQGILSLFIAFVGATVLASGGAWAAAKGMRPWVRSRLIRAGMYLLLGVATVAVMRLHATTATSRAEQLIAACGAYKEQHGVFPDRLEALVPTYIPAGPRAKYTLTWGNFTYSNWSSDPDEPRHVLMYVAMPPFGRRLYNLEQGHWWTLD